MEGGAAEGYVWDKDPYGGRFKDEGEIFAPIQGKVGKVERCKHKKHERPLVCHGLGPCEEG